MSTTVVTKDELAVRNLPTLDRALELMPGVYVFRSRGTADLLSRVMMRGFNGANRTLTLLDGMPLNDAYTGDVTWTSLPTGEVERVEVVRGPFSSLYGGNAMGGVINVLTRVIEKRQLHLMTQAGTYGTAQVGGHYGDRIGPFGLSIGYQRLQTNGYAPREIVVTPTTAGTGTPVTGAVATQSATGTPAFIVGSAGRNWYDQDAARVKRRVDAERLHESLDPVSVPTTRVMAMTIHEATCETRPAVSSTPERSCFRTEMSSGASR